MKTFTTLVLLLSCFPLLSQEEPVNAEEAIQKVFDVLSGRENNVVEQVEKNLKSGAWEALAYVDAGNPDTLSKGDLQEAVPDYYRFRESDLLLKLIDQQDYNRYGVELEVPYSVSGQIINLFDAETGALKDKWEILYLDDSYLALDMGDLRLFFARTADQE